MKRIIRMLLVIIFAAVFLFSAWQVFGTLKTYSEGRKTYSELEQYVTFADERTEKPAEPAKAKPKADESEKPIENKPSEEAAVSVLPQVDFEKLAKINSDIVGWLYIKGTNVNYPVVQGPDNDYYLTRMFDGSYNKSGSIFLDYRCSADFSDRQTIIHGHHMKNKTMFSGLTDYKEQAFYDDHSTAVLVTPSAYYEVMFFSGYVSDNFSSAWKLGLEGAEFERWLGEIQQKSCFEPSGLPTAEDRILTLSTCTYDFDDAKFVLHGYLRETDYNSVYE